MKGANSINIEGGELPFSFGMAALTKFCEAHGLSLSEFSSIGENMPPRYILSLVWHGLQDGARKERKDFSLSLDDVGDLIDENPAMLQQAMDMIATAMQGTGNGKAPAKKTGARR